MKFYKFITTFSNIQGKFAVVAYPEELSSYVVEVKKKSSSYSEIRTFGDSELPVKYRIFYINGFKFFSKTFFLGHSGTNDDRGGNYITTTIAIDETINLNPLSLFQNKELWEQVLTPEEDARLAKSPIIPPLDIKFEYVPYEFITQHRTKLKSSANTILKLISLFVAKGDKDILLNSTRGNYTSAFFFLSDILPTVFLDNYSITLHPSDPDKENANFVETIQYGPDKIKYHERRYDVIDNFNVQITTESNYESSYLVFLQGIMDTDDLDISKLSAFNELYDTLKFAEHNSSSLNQTVEIISGKIEMLFQLAQQSPAVDLPKACLVLIRTGSTTWESCLSLFLGLRPFARHNQFGDYFEFTAKFKEEEEYSLYEVITVYENQNVLSSSEIAQLIVDNCEHQSFDIDTAEYLLQALEKRSTDGPSMKYGQTLAYLKDKRPDLINTTSLSKKWNEYQLEEAILKTDNPKAVLFFFKELLTKDSAFTATDNEMAFRCLRVGLNKPWKAEHLELCLSALYKKMFQKASIASFIHQFLEYAEHHEDGDTPSAEFILRNIINQITEKDPRLLFLLCRELDDSRFQGVMKSEIENRFAVQQAHTFLHPVG